MSKLAFACGATSDPRLPLINAARCAKLAMLTRNDSPSDHEETYIASHEMAGGHSDRRPLLILSRDAVPCGIVPSSAAKG